MFCRLVLLALLAWMVNSSYGNHLIGDHVCTTDETYTVTFEKPIKKIMTRREFVWCMSVPPRCSKYIPQEVDAIEIVEEQRIRKIDVCCEGYIEDKTQTYCIPKCKSCIQGICTAPENCSCKAGFTGVSCNQTCEAGFWGQDCALQCSCANGAPCIPETGSCVCEPGTTGQKCETIISLASKNCSVENCNKTNNQNPQTVQNETKEVDIISETILAVLPTEKPTTTVPSTNTNRLETSTHPGKENNHTPDDNTSIASKKNFNSTGRTHLFSDKRPEHWQMDQIVIENSDSSVKDTLLVFIISIGIGILVILILVAFMSLMIARYKKQRDLAIKNVLNIKSTIDNNKNRLSTEPIIQRSVFHAPLPDPPIFQNPVFTLQDCQHAKVLYNNCSETQSQYDFPPSSGSYRAASLPDSSLQTTQEPLYDEIPASRRPRPVSTMNGCRHSCCGHVQCPYNT